MALGLNLVNHWLLNNNSNDNTGTLDGADSGGVEYKGDNVTFDGTSGYIDTGYVPPASSTYTYSLWAKTTDTTDSYMFSDEHGQSLGKYSRGSIGYLSGGSLILQLGDGVSNWFDISYNISTWLDGDYHHWALVFDAFSIKLYIDGVLRKSYTSTVSAGTLGSTDYWFGRGSSSAHSFSGDLSNARIYSDAKNQTQIDELFAEGYYPKPLTEPTTTGLIAHYPLTGTAEDSTGSYNGTEVGGLTYIDDGEFGSVVSLDGVDGEVVIDAELFNAGSGVRTYSLWAKYSTQTEVILACGLSGDNHVIRVRGDGILVEGDGDQSLDCLIGLSNDTWGHIVIEVNMTTKVITSYLDGTLNDTEIIPANNTVWNPTNNPSIGGYQGGSEYGNAEVHSFRCYTRTLTQQEIIDIYNYEKNFRSIDIDDGLVAYYPLANNSLDNYYNEYDGTDTAITYDGESALFNGTSSKIIIPDEILVNTDSISLWFNTSTILGSARIFFAYSGNGGNNRFYIDRDGLSLQITIGLEGALVNVYTITTGVDYFLTLSKTSPTTTDVYIDNVFVQTLTYTALNPMNNRDYSIGSIDTGGDYFDGEIKHVRFYNKGLTPEQIKVIYDSETTEVVEEIASGSGSVLITSSKSLPVDYTPQGSGSAIITSSKALANQYIPYSVDGGVVVTGTSEVEVGILPSEIFTFVQTIQKANIESHFIFVQSIEQPINSIIIKRVNQ